MSDETSVASPELTGGAGFTFEDRIVAIYLAALLGEVPAPGTPGRYVIGVELQRAAFGQPMDDLVVKAAGQDGTSATVALQVKRALTISSAKRNADFRDVVAKSWATLTREGFRLGVDRIGAVTGSIAGQSKRAVETICEWARLSPSAEDFIARFRAGAAGAAHRRVRDAFEAALKAAHAGADDGDLHRLLASFVLITRDLLHEGSPDEAQTVALLKGYLMPRDAARADELFGRLAQLARDAAGRAGQFTRPILLSQLRGRFKFAPATSLHEDLRRLRGEAERALAEIDDEIQGFHIPRDDALAAIHAALETKRFVQISGLPGVGKSVVLRHMASAAVVAGPAIILKADRLEGRGWAGYATARGLSSGDLTALMVEIGATGTPILFIDELDRVEVEHRAVVNDILNVLSETPELADWRVVATVRDNGQEPFRKWVSPRWLAGGTAIVEVEPLSDSEAEMLAKERPHLRSLLFGSGALRELARRPFFMSVLPRLPDSAGLAAETDLIEAWWRAAGYNSPPIRAGDRHLGLEPEDGVARVLQRELRPLHGKLRDHVSDSKHGELDEAMMHLDQGKPHDASVLLRRLRRHSWVDLTRGQQFRWCRLQADVHLRLGEDREAAKLLVEARRYAPDDEQGMTNEILAWRILDDLEKARAIAKDARKRFPHSAAAYAACIEVAVSTEEADSLARSVPTELQDATDILVAIAARLDLGELAEQAARRGVEVAPEDIKTWFAFGTFVLDVEQQKVNLLLPGPKQLPSTERLHEARDAFSKVIELATRTGNIAVRVAALLRRAFVWGVLGNAQEVRRDTERARQLAPDDRDALVASACSAEDRGDHEAAAEILREVVAKSGDDDEARFFLAISVWNKQAPEDRAEATRLFATVAKGACSQREPALDFCIEGLIDLGLPAEASNLLGEVEATIEPALAEALRARLAKSANDDAEASRHADNALAAVTERTPRSTLKKVATVLMSVERLTDALPLLQQAAAPGADKEVGRRLVDCAGRLEQHGVVLDYCRRARENGQFDEYLIARELQLLDRYEPTTALTILQDVLSQKPNHHARIHLVQLALRLGQWTLAKEHVPLLPGVMEVDALEGATIVWILLEVGRARDALSFAYDLLRCHFSDHHAHHAFLDPSSKRAGRN